ncbi:MAG: hypothetical protein GC162_07530 [Planctomycetes bacterium]|nr:hypothetical protein [Planctomycetota bacterium]
MNATLMDLLDLLCEGDLSTDQAAALEGLVRESEEARRLYLNAILCDGYLRFEFGAGAASPVIASPMRRARWRYAALAVAIVLAVGLSMLTVPRGPEPAIRPSVNEAPVAMLSDISRDVVFADAPHAVGTDLMPGVIALKAGTAQVVFHSGAVVDLAGPCRFEMTGANRGRLSEGALHAFVNDRAHGFAVDGPDGVRVVDLGTRFMMRVDDGRTRVAVIEGTVETRIENQMIRLTAGQGVNRQGDAWVVTDANQSGIAGMDDHVRFLTFGPPVLRAGVLEDSHHLFVLRERANYRLRKTQSAGVVGSGSFSRGNVRSGTIPAGTCVDSYLLHFDAEGDTSESKATLDALIIFARPILGVIAFDGIVEADATFGAPDVQYEADTTRGIEQEDTFAIGPDGRTLRVHLTGWRPDELRVLVASEPAASQADHVNHRAAGAEDSTPGEHP